MRAPLKSDCMVLQMVKRRLSTEPKMSRFKFMHSKSISFVIALLAVQVHKASSCTFVEQEKDFLADATYTMLKESKDLCLRTCYEEADCTFVEYFEGVCKIFEDGETRQAGSNNVYKLDCQHTLSTCRRLPLASEKKYRKLSVPEVRQSKARMMELLAMDKAEMTVIHTFNKNGFFFTKSKSAFTDGTPIARSLVFAKDPQPECVSVPVFQKASQHKLYFGEIYNVSGYEFLDAYAFTSYCACEGMCCGQIRLTTSNTVEYRELSVGPLNHVMSDAEQTLYIANVIRGYDNTLWAETDSTECVDLI